MDDKDTKYNLKHPKPREILLECGQGNGGIIFRQPTDPSSNIAHVTIDTTCLVRPEVLIEFSSIIKVDTNITDLMLEFELFRVCDNKEPVALGIWSFEKTGAAFGFGFGGDKAFSFIFCDSLACPGCCEYFVTVTVSDIEGSSDFFAKVDNERMIAIAFPTTDCRHNNPYKSLNEKCDSANCLSNYPKTKKILLKCGDGSGNRRFTSSNDPPFQLAYVTIDTTNLCKPLVSIEFSSSVCM